MALNSGIQTYQILTNDDEVCIPSLFSILLAVCIGVWKQRQQKLSCYQGLKVLDSTENNLRKRFYNFRKKFWISSCYQNFQVRFLGESSRSCKHLLLRKNRLWPIDQIFDHKNDFSGLWKMFLSGQFAKRCLLFVSFCILKYRSRCIRPRLY